MRRLLSIVGSLCVTMLCFCCHAEIPQGRWMKKNIDSSDNSVSYQTLELNFNNPKSISDMLSYGSIALQWGSDVGWFLLSKPEISGNNVSCKAYYYEQYLYGEEPDKLFCANNGSVNCEIHYDDSSGTVTVNINDKKYAFAPNSQCNRVVSNANNLNVRRSPVNGQKIGTMTMGQTLPMLSIAPQKKGADWYEVMLPDGNKGYVSGQFASCVSQNWLSIPEGMIKPNVSFVHVYDEAEPSMVRQTTLDFIRNGSQIMCHSFTGFPLVFRLPIDVYMMGHIEENKIILDHWINPYGSDVDSMEIFDSGNFNEFAKHASIMNEPEIFYFDSNSNLYGGRVFDTAGFEFIFQDNSVY